MLAHGSIPYTDGSQNAQDGCVWECGLSPYSGRAVVDGWKHVLASGRLRQPCGPALLSLQARSPSRVFGGSTEFLEFLRVGLHAPLLDELGVPIHEKD